MPAGTCVHWARDHTSANVPLNSPRENQRTAYAPESGFGRPVAQTPLCESIVGLSGMLDSAPAMSRRCRFPPSRVTSLLSLLPLVSPPSHFLFGRFRTGLEQRTCQRSRQHVLPDPPSPAPGLAVLGLRPFFVGLYEDLSNGPGRRSVSTRERCGDDHREECTADHGLSLSIARWCAFEPASPSAHTVGSRRSAHVLILHSLSGCP